MLSESKGLNKFNETSQLVTSSVFILKQSGMWEKEKKLNLDKMWMKDERMLMRKQE